ncbi:MAG: SDR family oxidoreductase [Rhodobacteraceae bacterium]|nr:MAG: SDR family oxidoreductase [Paracoccaceae bacterium]
MTAGVLLTIGHGYVASALSRLLLQDGWRVIGTTRSTETAEKLREGGVEPVLWPLNDVAATLAAADHLLVSTPPGPEGDPAFVAMATDLAREATRWRWMGYLSTTGVYGDHGGAWVDEDTPTAPTNPRAAARVAAERGWLRLWTEHGFPAHVFRLPGIYGPGRTPFARIRAGSAQRIVKAGQVFSRIHVGDLAAALAASIRAPAPGSIWNICDDEPAPPQDVLGYAARLIGAPPPPEIPIEAADLSPMGREFYADNKRVANARMKRDLISNLRYPSFREGLASCLDD